MDPNIILSEQDIEKLIAAHDGDMALVYLYCRCRGVSGEDAARDLCMTAAAVEAAQGVGGGAGHGVPGGENPLRVDPRGKFHPAQELGDHFLQRQGLLTGHALDFAVLLFHDAFKAV